MGDEVVHSITVVAHSAATTFMEPYRQSRKSADRRVFVRAELLEVGLGFVGFGIGVLAVSNRFEADLEFWTWQCRVLTEHLPGKWSFISGRAIRATYCRRRWRLREGSLESADAGDDDLSRANRPCRKRRWYFEDLHS